ncbi:hypothetical protein VNO80_17946 [Phaseolus coccineus]|uniref:Legumain prodomain domain-containing protein n=1 Tax=Phaseolus coccineus TaxID=3886 RepID=A0AAN9MGQ9_PHACN
MGDIKNYELVGEGFTLFILIFYSNLLQLHAHHRSFSDPLSHCHPPLGWPPPGICLEACESGSIFEGLLPEGLNIYATTSAKAEEDSCANCVRCLLTAMLRGQKKDYGSKALQYGDIEFRKALVGSSSKTAAQKQILKVRTFETHCGSLSGCGMKHMRSFAIFCDAGIRKEQMAEASAQACVRIPATPWSSLDSNS